MTSISAFEKSSRFVSDWGVVIDNTLRRSIDISASILGFILLSPVFLLLAVMIQRDSPGPVFFKGQRLGKKGKLFKILKFRTMYERPESYAGPCLTGACDNRITPLGSWLRETKLNELPQLWNVLIGEMSLVGPRPEDPQLAEEWTPEIREQLLAVRPGITSPASIIYKEEESQLSAHNLLDDYFRNVLPSKIILDTRYLSRRTVLSDLDIIFLTFIALLPGLRKAAIPEKYLYRGPLSSFFHFFLNWFVLDWFISFLAFSITGIIWRLHGPINWGWRIALENALIIALVFSLTNLILGINRITWRKAPPEASFGLGLSTAVSTFILIGGNYFLNINALSINTEIITTSGVLAWMGFVTMRYRDRILTGIAARWLNLRKDNVNFGERAIIVGAGDLGEFVSVLMRGREFTRTINLVGFVDDDLQKISTRMNGLLVLDTTAQLPRLMEKHQINLVIFAVGHLEDPRWSHLLDICKTKSARVVMFPNLMDLLRSSYHTTEPLQCPADPLASPCASQILAQIDDLLDRGDYQAAHHLVHHCRKDLHARVTRPSAT